MKQYTLDGALLTETPEVRIGDKIYKVDNRTSTVKKLQEISQDDTDGILKVAYGEQAMNEINDLDMPFPALMELILITVSAMTGETLEEVRTRFRQQLTA